MGQKTLTAQMQCSKRGHTGQSLIQIISRFATKSQFRESAEFLHATKKNCFIIQNRRSAPLCQHRATEAGSFLQ